MGSTKLKCITVIALTPLATACSLFGTSSSASMAELRFPTADEQLAARAALAMEEGRAHLAAGNPGLAIETFQRVLASGESVGSAANGVAVAYARIGRADLARRYFHQAIATSPESPIYLANLERLESSLTTPTVTQVAARSSRDAPLLNGEPVAVRSPAPEVKQTGARAGVVRISRSEVRISTVSSSGEPSAAYAQYLERNFQPVVRITLERHRPASTSTRSVIRITLPEATSIKSSREVVAQGTGGRSTG